jgi:hypothetical protein
MWRQSAVLLLFALSACDVYSARSGAYSAGGVDPVNFPPAYLGVGGNRTKPGLGSFTEVRAYAAGQPVGYFAFPFSTSQLPPGGSKGMPPDPLKLVDAGTGYAPVPVPRAYDFSAAAPCSPPRNNYVYDPRVDEVPYDRQGNLFTALPTATYNPGMLPTWSYVPVVQRVPVMGGPLGCQTVVDEASLLMTSGLQAGPPDGTYLAWAIIDADAPVYRIGQSMSNSGGWGTQQLGWYNHYILTYLDGGAVPTTTAADGTVEMVTMALYYPRSKVQTGMNTVAGGVGFGYDVVDAARGQAGYSPVCKVFTYDAGGVMTPDQLPKDVATIKASFGASIQPANPPYFFCLQVQP